jgi:hypothetical protein
MEDAIKKPSLKAILIERMHDPLQLRAALCVLLLVCWYSVAYTPLAAQIVTTTSQLQRDRKRLGLAKEVEALRVEAAQFKDRIPPRSDPNEFLQYVLAGVRKGPLKLGSLSPERSKEAGPFQLAAVRLELLGLYPDVEAFLRWVETDQRLLRVDALKMEPEGREGEGQLKVLVTIVGLMGAEETEKDKDKNKQGKPDPKEPSRGEKTKPPAASKPAPKPADTPKPKASDASKPAN